MFVDCTIRGVSPLLMNAFYDAAAQKASEHTRSALSNTGDKGTPEQQAERRIYHSVTGSGEIVIPSTNVYSCIIEGGKWFKVGRSKLTTQKSSLLPGIVQMVGIEYPLKVETKVDGGRLWSVSTLPVVNPSTGGRILCHRPVYYNWGLTFTLEVDTAEITVDLVRQIVDKCGKAIGLGDYRPQRKGPYGRFVVDPWVEREEELDIAA